MAALAQFQAIDLKAVARLCLDMVEAYPDEVTVVLWNRKVALQAAQLLKAMARNPDAHSGARGAVALARAILGAGHRMGQPVDGKKGDWPAEVNAMLEERYAADVRYWVAKIQKFDEKPYKHGVQTFIALGNLHEMREATSALLGLGAQAFELVNGPRSGELAQAFHYALAFDQADAVRELVRSPLVAALRSAAVKKMVLAINPTRVPGLFNAMRQGHGAVIEAFGELLATLETRFNDEDLAQVLWAARVTGPQVSGVAEALVSTTLPTTSPPSAAT